MISRRVILNGRACNQIAFTNTILAVICNNMARDESAADSTMFLSGIILRMKL
jgi:hypothetical protein